MKLYNTLTRQLEDFDPLQPAHVRMYNCGPTVYGDQHVGNYRTFAFADTLRRYFEYKGWRVTQIINITDVGHLTLDDIESGEDKIDVMARQMGWSAWQVALHFMERYLKDRRLLNFQEPAKFTRATEHIPEMIALIERLLLQGSAYLVNGNVYFDVTKFPRYGRLSGNSLGTLKAGARIEIHPDKRHPTDFALWKTDPKHLMQWDAPWSRGFPGWHIECSAMSMKYLGDSFDIHTGGEDNIFPHHECEIAQSEAATGKPFVSFWLHARHILWDGQKMSKSLSNVFLVEDLLKRGYQPAEIRYALVRTHYRQQVDFSWSLFDDSKKALARLLEFRHRLEQAAVRVDHAGGVDLEAFRADFEAALDDDLDVSGALGVVHRFARDANGAIDQEKLGGTEARKALELLDRFSRVFGLPAGAAEEKPPPEVLQVAQERVLARRGRDYAKADELRDKIRSMGWSVEDTREGFKLRRI